MEELRYKEGCGAMEVVWEHARAIAPELRKREHGVGRGDEELQERLFALRKKRELERRKQEILQGRAREVEERESRLTAMREEIEKRKEAMRRKQREREALLREEAGRSRASARTSDDGI